MDRAAATERDEQKFDIQMDYATV